MDAEEAGCCEPQILPGRLVTEATMASRELLAQGRQFFSDAQEHIVAPGPCRSRFGVGHCNGLVAVFYSSVDSLSRATALGMMCKECERWTSELEDQLLPGET